MTRLFLYLSTHRNPKSQQQHDAEKKSFLPSHLARLTLDHLKLAAVESHAAAFRATVDHDHISDATLDHVQTIHRSFTQSFVRWIDRRPTGRAKVVSRRRLGHLFRRATLATAKTSLIVCHSRGFRIQRLATKSSCPTNVGPKTKPSHQKEIERSP
jgi:hypothetical protein